MLKIIQQNKKTKRLEANTFQSVLLYTHTHMHTKSSQQVKTILKLTTLLPSQKSILGHETQRCAAWWLTVLADAA